MKAMTKIKLLISAIKIKLLISALRKIEPKNDQEAYWIQGRIFGLKEALILMGEEKR